MLTLATKNKKVNLVFKTRKLVNITNNLNEKNFEEIFFEAISKLNLEALAKIIYVLAENNESREAFTDYEEVYDFIDEYKAENKKTYMQIFKEIAEAINEEGFFKNKMTEEELEKKILNPTLQVNLEDITKSSIEKAMTSIAEKEFLEKQISQA